MPSRQAEYENLVLNRRVEASSPFVSKSVWQSNSGAPEQLGPVYGGLDLSEVNDLTALVLVSPIRGLFHVKPTFWLPAEGLEERSRKDRVPYDMWAKDGHLNTTPGKAIQYEYVAEQLARIFAEHDVRQIAFDTYNFRHLRPWLLKAGIPEVVIDEKFREFRQGPVSMGPALRVLEGALLDAKLRHGNHPVLTMNMANAVARTDDKGNRQLDKKRSRGRIDGAVALAMAMMVASEDAHRAPVYGDVALDKILENMIG
jgi:phage terminase large subunit-like protein